jgi:hypothetical protein
LEKEANSYLIFPLRREVEKVKRVALTSRPPTGGKAKAAAVG